MGFSSRASVGITTSSLSLSHAEHGSAQACELILVRTANALDATMEAQAFQADGNLRNGLVEDGAQVFIAPATDRELSTEQGFKELLIVGMEEVVPLVRSSVGLGRCRQFA